jgi:plastocyanin
MAATTARAATTVAGAAEAILGASNNVFSPVKAAPGQKVRIASGDPVPHTAISPDNAWTFDEKTSSFTAPAKAGTYPFFCSVHGKGMSGTLTVA